MDDWKSCDVGSLGLVITGKTPSKNNPQDWGKEILFVTPSDFGNYGKYAETSKRMLSNEGAERLKKKILPPHSVLVTCIGSDLGKVVKNKQPCITNQQINSIIPKEQVNSDFLYYSLVGLYDSIRIYGSAGTAVPIVNKSTFESFEINLPSPTEQEAIAEVLSCLDDKIDLLKRQNKTLEGMAEALFRQWFIEEAQDDWEEVELSRHVSLGSGFPFKSKTYVDAGSYRIATIKHVQDGYLDVSDSPFVQELPAKIKPHCLLKEGDVLLSLTGNVGRCCIVDQPNILLNQRVASVLPFEPKSLPFWYFFFRYPSTKLMLDQLAHGTAQKNLSPVLLLKEQIQLPTNQRLNAMFEVCEELFKKLLQNFKVEGVLTKKRDLLLPKLMSGEVRVQLD